MLDLVLLLIPFSYLGRRSTATAPTEAVSRRRVGGYPRVSLRTDVARRPAGRHGDAVALLLREPQQDLRRSLAGVHRPRLEPPAADHVVEQRLATLRAEDRDRPVHARDAAARDVGELGREVPAVMALDPRVLLRLVERHLHHLAVLPVDEDLSLDVELLHVGERDAHLVLDLLDHEALVREDLGAKEADGEVDDVTEALQELRLPLDVLGLLAAVVQVRGVGELDLSGRGHLTRDADEAHPLQPHLLRVREREVVRAVGVPGARAGDRVLDPRHDARLRRGGRRLVGRRHDRAVEAPRAEAVAEDRGHDAAVLAAGEDLGILAPRRDDAPVAAEHALVDALGLRQHEVAQIELARPEPRADLGADVAPDALADAAEVERAARLRHLLRLPVDVVDDVVRADEHAGAALAAAPVVDDLVHHLPEARIRLAGLGRLHDDAVHLHAHSDGH